MIVKNGQCPVCGKKTAQKSSDVAFPTKSGKVTVSDLTYQECSSCKEKVFSQDAQEKIERAVYGDKRKRAG